MEHAAAFEPLYAVNDLGAVRDVTHGAPNRCPHDKMIPFLKNQAHDQCGLTVRMVWSSSLHLSTCIKTLRGSGSCRSLRTGARPSA